MLISHQLAGKFGGRSGHQGHQAGNHANEYHQLTWRLGFNSLANEYLQLTWPLTSMNPLTTDDAIWHHLTLAACYQLVQSVLKIGFCASKKGGIGVGGRVLAQGAMHMATALAGYRKALVGRHWLDHFSPC